MFLTALLQWWYTAGWGKFAQLSATKINHLLDLFSVKLLIRSLFAPFRETFTDHVRGAVDAQLRAWADRQISRGIGFMIRSSVIVFGLLVTGAVGLIALVLIALWPLIPLLPVIAVIITVIMS